MPAATRHPLLGALAVMLAWHAALFAAAEFLNAWQTNLVAALVPLAIVAWLGWWREAAVIPLTPRRAWVLLPALALGCVYLVDPLEGSAEAWRETILLVLCVGISEELYARGVMQHVLEALGRVRTIVWGGILFGLGHGLSGAWFGRPLDDTIVQVFETAAFGAAFAAMRFEIATLWPLALLHAFDDLAQLRTSGALVFGGQMAVAALYAAYAWWLARRPVR